MKLKRFNFKEVNSTNNSAIKIIQNSKNRFGIVVADRQKKGRGQYGKKWTSYKGNLFVSIFFPTSKIKLSLKDLTIINCVLVKKVIAEFYKAEIFIKKPNDLLINRKKISGILQENISKSGKTFIIIGIGINLIKSPKIEGYTTTNLFDLTNIKVNSHNMALKLKKIYEKFIPILSKINVRNINRI